MHDDLDPLGSSDVSYSYRARPETTFAVVRNRVGVTASLFGTAIGLSYLLGRSRP